MPFLARPVLDERDALLFFLSQQRDALRAAVFGLTDEQARATPSASGLCLGGLVKHAARVERRWVVAGIGGRPLPGLWPVADWPADFRMSEDETLDGMLGYYAETATLTGEIVAGVTDLGQPLTTGDDGRTVRWALFHLIAETARHAGHADIIRESLDGGRLPTLLPAYEAGSATG